MISERQQWINLAGIIAVIAAFSAWFLIRSGKAVWKSVTLAIFGAMAFIALSVWSIPYLDRLIDWVSVVLNSAAIRPSIGLVVFLLGVSAYGFKLAKPVRYGQMEMAFGVFTASIVGNGLKLGESRYSHVAVLGAAVYVVVRGLSNWGEGLKDPRQGYHHASVKDHVWSWFFEEEDQPPVVSSDKRKQNPDVPTSAVL